MPKSKIGRINIHPDVTLDAVIEACERQMTSLDNPGFCILCGIENGSCEPDARGNPCETCGQKTVYGSQELLFRMA